MSFDLKGLIPGPITLFTKDGRVDFNAIQRLGSWLGSINGVKGLVVLGHAGEGTFLTQDEQVQVIEAFVKSGTEVAAYEAKRAKEAGAQAGLLYPSHGWLRFGYQPGAPQDRYKTVYENGVRNVRRWDTEIPLFRKERPNVPILTCHDEYLQHKAFEVDGMRVGYGNIAPEELLQLIEAGKGRDYKRARQIHDQLLPLTKAVYYQGGSHMEGTVPLKHVLVGCGDLDHATVRSPLVPPRSGVNLVAWCLNME
ncbi:uncharacterized protein IWZ02DRAFT_473573 [Phyllosticta citriasiana]|uniref:uncharacterized protein n=1 Tax=Phyllosticta citriasiana TaxID=595635 RepID=UPI0030FD50BE